MPILLNTMKSLAFACAVLFFIMSYTIVAHDHVLNGRSYWDPVPTDVQPRESRIVPWTTQPVSSPGCPERCSCQMDDSHQIIFVNCSNKGLKMVPDFPTSTVILLLSNNSLNFSTGSASCESFKHLWSLQYLDLAYNKILDLPPCLFQSQTGSLLALYISYNDIDQLDQKLFENLSRLNVLDLSFNLITQLAAGTFSDLVQLIELNLSFNYIGTIDPHAFKGLHSLKILELENNRLNVSFPRDVFEDLGALEELYITGNEGILDEALSPLKNLSCLAMDVTPEYTKLGCGFRQLTNLSTLSFSNVRFVEYDGRYKIVSNSHIETIPSDFFENIQTKKNLTLLMVGCNIYEIGISTFNFLPTLVTLDIRLNGHLNLGMECGDWIDSLTNTTISGLDFTWTTDRRGSYLNGICLEKLAKTNIKTLLLRYNSFYHIDLDLTDADNFPTTLETLIVSENSIRLYVMYASYVHVGYRDLKLRELNVNNQDLSQLISPDDYTRETSAWKNCPVDLKGQDPDIDIICLPPELETIHANSALGPNRKTVSQIRVLNNTVLSHVELTDNLLTNFLGPIENVPSLKVLNLSRNQCEKLHPSFFMHMVNLETLILKDNYLGLTLNSDINGRTFSTLANLRVLDMSQNVITDLSSQAFIHNTNLETLDLSNNRFSEFQPSISTVNNMSFLDLSINFLPGLSVQTCDELKVIKSKNENFTISLLDNPLLFTCDYLPFLDLVISNPHIFVKVESMQFKCMNETKIFYKDLAHHFPSLTRECLIQRLFDVILVAFFVVVGTVSFCAIIYHKRWKLRYLYYIGQRRMHIGEHIVEYAPDADVFITYDQDDLRWRCFMQQTFLPGLNQRNITYILGETDFPGGDIMAHVAGAVVGTRKTVVLLSGEIFDDHHREFEMNLAIMREMDTRSLKIVPVFVEEFNLALYPQEIEIFLRNQWHRCLYYDDGGFWDGFVAAVREDN